MSSILQDLVNQSLHENGDSDWHAMTIFSIAIQIKAKKILELGTRDGRTTMPLLLAASLTNGNVTSVDINDTSFNCPDELKTNWHFIKSDAIEFLSKQEQVYDLILIDDWHTYLHVKKELELLDKLTTPNSIILLHDLMGQFNHPNYFQPDSSQWNGGEWEGGGPYKAVAELDSNVWEWSTIPVNNGLTILRKKGSVKKL
jgi:predicted O-methyltransferase YrrM